MSILYHRTHLAITLPIATALLAFAGDDDTRPTIAIGIDEGYLCATNGYAGLRFEVMRPGATGARKPRNGTVWSHAYVKTALKVARARKATIVELPYADALDGKFPPFARVLPDYGVEATAPLGFNPIYFAALATVTKACDVQRAELIAARAPLDPIGFLIDDKQGMVARVVIMPMRA